MVVDEYMYSFTAVSKCINNYCFHSYNEWIRGLEQSISFVKNNECHKSNILHMSIAVF